LLAQLARAHLVEERRPGRFAFHDLLRAYAGEQARTVDAPADRHAAMQRVLDHYLRGAYRSGLLLNPHWDDPITLPPAEPGVTPEDPADEARALVWFTDEHAVLLAVLRQATADGFDTCVWQLTSTLTPFFEYHGDWHDWAETQRAALEAAARLADPHALALIYRHLGRARVRLGRYDEAHADFRQSLERYEELGDHAGQAHTHRAICWVLDLQGRHPQGLRHAEQALALFRSAGHRAGEGRALNAVGWFHVQLGDLREGLASCQDALALQRGIGDRFSQAETLDSLGCAHRLLGQYEQSAAAYRQALDLYREFGDLYNEADSLAHLGDTHRANGDRDSARTVWERAVVIFDRLDHPDAEVVRAKLSTLDERPRQPARSVPSG
jgi:tetratricopeptide (TPR) repeat protein